MPPGQFPYAVSVAIRELRGQAGFHSPRTLQGRKNSFKSAQHFPQFPEEPKK
jgi:hypothetical protein